MSFAKAGSIGTLHINLLQEYLQKLAPSLGCRPQEMCTLIEEKCGEQVFRARVELLNTAAGVTVPPMPWSSITLGVNPARQDAARRALNVLRESGCRPHDSYQVPLAIAVAHHGGHQDDWLESFLDEERASLLEIVPPGIPARGIMSKATSDAGAKAAETNPIGLLQEYLQKLAPSLGCRPEEMYTIIDEERPEQPQFFRARVELLNTAAGVTVPPMPWSSITLGVNPARQDAARRALNVLRESGCRPHDSYQVPLAIAVAHHGGHQDDRWDLFSDEDLASLLETVPPPTVLPDLTQALLSVDPVVCSARRAGSITAKTYVDSLGLLDLDLDPDRDRDFGAAGDGGRHAINMLLDTTQIPPNLGQLGEEYTAAWLRQQDWVAAGSVRWLNREDEAHTDHDIECTPTGEPGRSHIEVKTSWRRSKAKMSSRQLERLLNPTDDYMLLMVGDAHLLFESPPLPPRIRVLHSPKVAVTLAAHFAKSEDVGRAAGASKQVEQVSAPLKKPPFRRRDSAMWTVAANDAVQLVDVVLSKHDGHIGMSRQAIPVHIVEYVREGIGIEDASKHWRYNKKRLEKIMANSDQTVGGDASEALATQLGVMALLQVSAEVAKICEPGPEVETRLDTVDGNRYSLTSFVAEYGAKGGLTRWRSAER